VVADFIKHGQGCGRLLRRRIWNKNKDLRQGIKRRLDWFKDRILGGGWGSLMIMRKISKRCILPYNYG
jgi:hypothetical protein